MVKDNGYHTKHKPEFRVHNDFVRAFVKEVMVDWERKTFAACLGVSPSDLERHMARDDFITQFVMDSMRQLAALGLDLPEWPDHELRLSRYQHHGEVDFVWRIHRIDDGSCVGYGFEEAFDSAVSEAELFYFLHFEHGLPSDGEPPDLERPH